MMAYLVSGITLQSIMKATSKNAINSDTYTSFAANMTFSPETTLATGTSANQFDRVWYAEDRVINSASSEDLDMYDLAAFDIGGGAGKDALGIAFTNVELVGLAFWNKAVSTGTLYIGAKNAATAFNSIFHVNGTLDDTAGTLIAPGGFIQWFNPNNPAYAIADTSNHLLKLAATGGNVTYSCQAWFRSA
jgi:hypothetical protein